MKPSLEAIQKELKPRNIKGSYQRLKVLEYLVREDSHPTVDRIFTSLKKEIPTLSKTTVYNTLKTLTDAGMVRALTLDGHEKRYDIKVEKHGHIQCESCGTVHDFNIDLEFLGSSDLNDFKINDRNVYFKGICPSCLSKEKNQSKGGKG